MIIYRTDMNKFSLLNLDKIVIQFFWVENFHLLSSSISIISVTISNQNNWRKYFIANNLKYKKIDIYCTCSKMILNKYK